MFNHCRVSERVACGWFVWVHVRLYVCMCVPVCVRDEKCASVNVVRHDTWLCCKNDQNEPAPLFIGSCLSLLFVSATTLLHSDILLFITK